MAARQAVAAEGDIVDHPTRERIKPVELPPVDDMITTGSDTELKALIARLEARILGRDWEKEEIEQHLELLHSQLDAAVYVRNKRALAKRNL